MYPDRSKRMCPVTKANPEIAVHIRRHKCRYATIAVMDYPPPSSVGKAAWRRVVRRRRVEHAAHTDQTARDAAASVTVLSNPQVHAALAGGVGVYVATAHEPPTLRLRQTLLTSNVQVYVPWTQPDRSLLWLHDDGAARAWGVPGEPAAPPNPDEAKPLGEISVQLLIIPALAATATGQRLGQGGGYYDTLLAGIPRFANGGPLRVALVGKGELVADLPTESHDEPVDLVFAV